MQGYARVVLDNDWEHQASYDLQKLSFRMSSTGITGVKLDLVLESQASGLVVNKAVLISRFLILGGVLSCYEMVIVLMTIEIGSLKEMPIIRGSSVGFLRIG